MLRDRIRAEIERRQAVAQAAMPGPWRFNVYGIEFEAWSIAAHSVVGRCFEVVGQPRRQTAEHIALHDPADALRRYAAALRVLDRHQTCVAHGVVRADGPEIRHAPQCHRCGSVDWPCVEVRDLADSLGVPHGDDDAPP
jgi:hypothetical protein